MLDDADTMLDLVGVGLVLAIVIGLAVVGLNFAGSADDGTPDVEWTIERVNDSHVRVTHAGGEAVDEENLRVVVDSVERQTNWTGMVREGDEAVVPANDGSLVRVVWNGGRGDRRIMTRKRV